MKTVMSLRHSAEIKDFDEKQVVEAEGLTYLHLPFESAAELTDAVLDKAREHLKSADYEAKARAYIEKHK